MTKKNHYAGFWVRSLADIIDSTFLDLLSCMIGLIVLGAIFWFRRFGWLPELEMKGSLLESLESFSAQICLVVIRSGLSLFYYTWATFRFGTTLGKRPFRIRVVSAEKREPVTFKQSLLRCFGYVVSYLPFGCGFLMVAFQPEKRGLHDLIAGTVSVITPKPEKK